MSQTAANSGLAAQKPETRNLGSPRVPRLARGARAALIALVVSMFLAVSAGAQGVISVDAKFAPGVKKTGELTRRRLASTRAALAPPRPFDLDALSSSALPAEKRGLTRVGVSRPLPEAARSAMRWEPLEGDQQVWRFSVRSPGAEGLRLHFTRFDVGRGRVALYAPGDETAPVDGPYTGRGLHEDGEFWSGTIESDTVVVEYEPSEPVSPNEAPPFDIAGVAHLWEASPSPRISLPREAVSNEPELLALAEQPRHDVAARCHLDYKCYPDYEAHGRAVAQIVFQDQELTGWYACSGALLNTRNGSGTPYFLTAAHCVDTGTEARTVEAYWGYEKSACGGAVPEQEDAERISGAKLLAFGGMSEGDFSLLLLNGLPSFPHVFAGWTTAEPGVGTTLVGIHHPEVSYKRISFSERIPSEDLLVEGELAPGGKYYLTEAREGLTEKGSSGSPLFEAGPSVRVVGTLSYGTQTPPYTDVCAVKDHLSGYGRFNQFYWLVESYLEEEPPPPDFQVSPSAVEFSAEIGASPSPASQRVTVRTSSPSTVGYLAASDQPWLKLSGPSGGFSAAAPGVFEIGVDTRAFSSKGVHTGTVTVRAGTAPPAAVRVTVNVAAARSAVVASVDPQTVYQQPADGEGNQWFYELRLAETAGFDTRVTSFRTDSRDYSGAIASLFGTDALPAFGSLRASLRERGLKTPADQVFYVEGVDAGTGTPWATRVTAHFEGERTEAAMEIAVTPDPVVQDAVSPDCAWRHKVVLAERAGIGVNLRHWKAGEFDLSARIADWFGASRLAPGGRLEADVCWTDLRAPTSIRFEIGGEDDRGNQVFAAGPGDFVGSVAAGEPFFERNWVVNAASFQPALAPGMLFTIRGRNLAGVTSSAASLPLSPKMQGVSVRVNGIECPLLYVSPSQINAQLPYEVYPGTAAVTVDVAGRTETHVVQVRQVAPGIFTADGLRPAPHAEGRRGQAVTCYLTGVGAVAPAIATGHAPRPSDAETGALPRPILPVEVRVGGQDAPVLFAAIPWDVVGAVQVNYVIPSSVAPGRNLLEIWVGGQQAQVAYLDVLP